MTTAGTASASPKDAAADTGRGPAAGSDRGRAGAGRRAAAGPGRARGARAGRTPAEGLPIARVAVDVALAHLDRTFDYLVPAAETDAARPGVRVRVRFAGRLVDGYLLERIAQSGHPGHLAMLERVISTEPVLAPEIAVLCRAVADRYAGTLADVLRLAVPPRHARAESVDDDTPVRALTTGAADARATAAEHRRPDVPKDPGGLPGGTRSDRSEEDPAGCAAATAGRAAPAPAAESMAGGDAAATGSAGRARELAPADIPVTPWISDGWRRYPAGASFLAAVHEHRPARAVWQVLPGDDWAARFAEASAVSLRAGRGALLIVPDSHDLARLDRALAAVLPPASHLTLSADLGPAERYRRFLAVARGRVRVVAGTRAAAFAPVRDPGLLAIFDDGNDLLAEPRAPYPHSREVLGLRSAQQRCPLLIGGLARTAEAQLLVRSGWAHPILAERDELRRSMPRIEAAGDDYAAGAASAAARARLSPAAFDAARRALADGAPVLVQVPRRGYLPGLACADCGRPARCRRCRGPLHLARGARIPSCRWCGAPTPRLACPACGSVRIRATVTGAARTGEEIGRAFPGVRLRSSTGGAISGQVPAEAAIVVATPGAEPTAHGGYGAALLLDGGILLGRPDLRAAEEALRRWMAAAALVRPAADGGRVVVGADAAVPTVQALIRWDPVGHAEAELDAREALGFPPAVAMAAIDGAEAAVSAALAELQMPAAGETLGPVPIERPFGRDRAAGAAGRGASAARDDTDGVAVARADPEDDDAAAVRGLVRVARAHRKELAAALREVAASRSARKDPALLRIRVDPVELG